MMESRIVTSGLVSLDQVLQGLRLGDNVVWQVDRLEDYMHFAKPFARQAIRDGRRTIYFRFAPTRRSCRPSRDSKRSR